MQHLKERNYYEKLYDKITVNSARHNMKVFSELRDKFFEIMPDEPHDSHRAVLHLNLIYIVFVGDDLLRRYDDREEGIREMMAKDSAKDQQVADARLVVEPACQHCQTTGLRLTDKMLCHRDSFDEPEEVLFFLKCPKCRKNSGVWSDGKPLEAKKTPCPKCGMETQEEDSRKGKVITTIYTCLSCKHQHKSKLDFTPKEEEVDPNFETDRAIYGLHDERFRQELRDAKWRYEEMAKLGKEWKEKEDNRHIYDAIAGLKRPKIAELTPLLKPKLEEAGYIEFSLGKPENGKIMYVSFNCLDGRMSRVDRESRKNLHKVIAGVLIGTNWGLTSDGISYRLGYLTGRIRAYENEDELKTLMVKRGVSKKPFYPDGEKQRSLRGNDGREIIL